MLNKEVPSIELCKALKGLGWKHEGLYYWHDWHGEWQVSCGDKDLCSCKHSYAAPTVVEMLEVLPEKIRDLFGFHPTVTGYKVYTILKDYEDKEWIDNSLPNALAKTIIFLVKEGHIKLGVK